MSFLCSICNKSYVNKNSLAAHKSRYHKRKEDSSNRVDGKDLSSAFGSVITPSRDVNRTRYRNNQDLSDEAENMEDIDNKRGFKRRRSVEETSTDSNLSTEEDCDEYIKRVQREIRENKRKREKERIDRKLWKQNMDEKEESITKLGNDESEEDEGNHTKQSIRDIECRGLVLQTIVERIEKKYDRKFKKIEDTQDYILKKNGFIDMPYVEKCIITV